MAARPVDIREALMDAW